MAAGPSIDQRTQTPRQISIKLAHKSWNMEQMSSILAMSVLISVATEALSNELAEMRRVLSNTATVRMARVNVITRWFTYRECAVVSCQID